MSLRTRVLAGLGLVAVILLVVGVVVTRTTSDKLVRQVDAQLAAVMVPSQNYDEGPGFGPEGGGPGRLTPVYVGYVDGDVVETKVAPDLRGEDTPEPAITVAQATAAAASGDSFTVGSVGSDLRYRARAFFDARADRVVVVALPIDSVDDAVATLVTVELVGGAIILLTLGLVAWWVIHLGIRPLKAMTSAAATIAGGDLSHRVPTAATGTEAGDLGVALNQMLGHIEGAFDERTRAEGRLRQFVADASHELRTPVATIRGYAELYRSGGLQPPGALDDAMRRTEQEAIRMGGLVDDLLQLARLDQGRPLDAEPVDLAHLADDAARDARAVDPERAIAATTAGPLIVTGDEARLRAVLTNLVANALVHTPPGTPVEISAAREDGRAVVEVTDHGPGMSEAVAARAFERFYRADPARSRHRGGSGLGLSIVEATVRAHGGTAGLRSVAGEGTTARIELPLAKG